MVPQESAVVPGAANTETIAIYADHMNMVKFATKEDRGYETVSGHLQLMVKKAINVVPPRWVQDDRVNEGT